jgi:hypothetical protein
MTPQSFLGKVAAFYPSPAAVVRCLPVPGAQIVVGEIIDARTMPAARGNIPTLSLTIKGRSGRTATVCLVDNFVRTFTTWAEALDYAKS